MAIPKPVIPRLDRGIQESTGCPLKTCGHDEKKAMTLPKTVIPRLDREIQESTGCPLKTCGHDEKKAMTLSLGEG